MTTVDFVVLKLPPHLTHDSLFRHTQAAAEPSYRSAVSEDMDPLVAESSKRLASIFARAQMELRQLKTIASRAAVLNRNADPSTVETHAAIDQNMMKGSQRRLRSLFRSADLEIQRMQKVASRSVKGDKIRAGKIYGRWTSGADTSGPDNSPYTD